MPSAIVWILIIHSLSSDSWNHGTSQAFAIAEFSDREACIKAGHDAKETFGRSISWLCAPKSSEKPIIP